jgi:integral membrane protein (TIGR01906 family)
MADVRSLIQLDHAVQISALLLLLISGAGLFFMHKAWRDALKAVFAGSIATLALIAALSLIVLISFDRLFLVFHQISFANQFWILDPRTDYLIMLFPGAFFNDIVVFLLGVVAALLAVAAITAFLVRKKLAKLASGQAG